MNFSVQVCGKFVYSLGVFHRKNLGVNQLSVYINYIYRPDLWKSLVVHICYPRYFQTFTQTASRYFTEAATLFSTVYTYPTITTTRKIFIN